MKVLCFGIAKEIINQDVLLIDDQNLERVSDLKLWLAKQYPDFETLKSYMIAVNQTYAIDTDSISDSDEIAIIPPVAGG